ncbi:ribonuclease III [Sphingomonas swuensis]|uniref:Ribonuclease 3 n=1 Tax=Sphingomonas swuensis TaxID=977800 RepID=A0ABP7SJ29_9SPHN
MSGANVKAFVAERLGHAPKELSLFERALTHPSHGKQHYQRLEFLGDRVLGLVIAEWLEERFPRDPEGQLSHRLTSLVSRATCAEVGQAIGVPATMRLGRQAREDGAARSENVVGDVVEALIAALYLDGGLEKARQFIRVHWEPHLAVLGGEAPRHPKSLLHELAEARKRRSPAYEVVHTSGPSHAPKFTVKVSLGSLGEAEGVGSSKQEAETAAAAAMLEKLK